MQIPVAGAEAQRIHDRDRTQRADQCGKVGERQSGADQQRAERAKRGAARDAEDVGVSKRVAQQHLQQHAGGREQPAARERRERARQPQPPDHVLHNAGDRKEYAVEYVEYG